MSWNPKLSISKENFAKGQEIVKTLVKEKEDLKANLKTTVLEAQALVVSEKSPKESLEDVLRLQKKLEGDDQYFDRAKEQITFPYPEFLNINK